MFGKPGEGLHSVRLFGVALIDVSLTLLIGALIAYYWKLNIYVVLGVLFVTGIVAHKLFCVKTALNNMIFG